MTCQPWHQDLRQCQGPDAEVVVEEGGKWKGACMTLEQAWE